MPVLSLDEQIALASNDSRRLAQLANILHAIGEKARARDLALRAFKLSPNDGETRSLTARLLSRGVPDWHFDIVMDAERNGAYQRALERAVTPDKSVLEIGTGSGILAMMAARAGARRVVTCETMPAVAEVAAEIIASNGFADRVAVVAKQSLAVDCAKDMGGPADILVQEIIGNRLLGEGVIPALEHAVRELLKPGAKVIPSRAIVRVALAHDAKLGRHRMGIVNGFDLSAFNRLAEGSYRIARGDSRLTLLSPPADLFDFDFQNGKTFPPATAAIALNSLGGCTNGIVQWIVMEMDEHESYENDPRPGATSAWAVIFWPFPSPRDFLPGETVNIRGSHDRLLLRVWADLP